MLGMRMRYEDGREGKKRFCPFVPMTFSNSRNLAMQCLAPIHGLWTHLYTFLYLTILLRMNSAWVSFSSCDFSSLHVVPSKPCEHDRYTQSSCTGVFTRALAIFSLLSKTSKAAGLFRTALQVSLHTHRRHLSPPPILCYHSLLYVHPSRPPYRKFFLAGCKGLCGFLS